MKPCEVPTVVCSTARLHVFPASSILVTRACYENKTMLEAAVEPLVLLTAAPENDISQRKCWLKEGEKTE